MIPNLFESVLFTTSNIKNTIFHAIYITNSAGVDSAIPEHFTKQVEDSDGMMILGVIYDGIDNTQFSAWYNDIDNLTTILHLEASYKVKINNDIYLNLRAQFADYTEENNSLADGTMYGLSVDAIVKNLQLYSAYNKTSNDDGKSVRNISGGGRPYVTSMDTLTLSGLSNVEAYRLGLGYDIVSNVNVSYYHATFNYGQSNNGRYTEQDLFATYKVRDDLNAVLVYTNIDHTISDLTQDNSFERIRGYINFTF